MMKEFKQIRTDGLKNIAYRLEGTDIVLVPSRAVRGHWVLEEDRNVAGPVVAFLAIDTAEEWFAANGYAVAV